MQDTDKIRNLEFRITFSETNLRWLAGEPESERRSELIAFNQSAIATAKAKLAEVAP